MSFDQNFARAYPLVFSPQTTLPYSILGDLDIVVYAAGFKPAKDRFFVTAFAGSQLQINCSHTDISPITVTLRENDWATADNSQLLVRALSGKLSGIPSWTGQEEIEPTRVTLMSGVRQAVEVYNEGPKRMPERPGCLPYPYPDPNWVDEDGYVLMCGPYLGSVVLAGGYSSRVAQYDSQGVLQISGDQSGGEGGKPCEGQISLHPEDIPLPGRSTSDGAARCTEVLKSINGISVGNFSFQAGNGVRVFAQPAKSRVTVRFDGAGSARCPDTDIEPADCPPQDDPFCGPVIPISLCPDAPTDLAAIREPGQIPDVSELPIVGPGLCDPLTPETSHLGLRGCGNGTARYDGLRWQIMRRCNPHCLENLTNLPTTAESGAERTFPCSRVPADTTVGFRNQEFGDSLQHWGTIGAPQQILSDARLTTAELPAIRIDGGQAIYQTEVSLPYRSAVKFDYIGAPRLLLAVFGGLCVDVLLPEVTEVTTYISEYRLAANRPISVQFAVPATGVTSIVSFPHLAIV